MEVRKDFNCQLVAHWVLIVVKDKGRNVIEHRRWGGLPFTVRCKWGWYYEFIAAKLKVKYPRLDVLMTWGNEEPNPVTYEQLKRNLHTSAKGKLTEYRNKLEAYEKSYNSLFPIELDPLYIKAKEKVKQRELALNAYL